jgi:hypothetical protein
MATAIFRHRIEPLTATDPSLCANVKGLRMPENTSNTVPCCVTDIGTGRIWWEWRQGHWIIAVKPAAAPGQKRHKANATDS